MRSLVLALALLISPLASAQTVVEMDLASACQLLSENNMARSVALLTNLANNYKQHTNIRVHTRRDKGALAMLAKALRTDFDGSGSSYIPDLTVWAIYNQVGGRTYLAASLMDPDSVLLTTQLDYLKGMLAFEILHQLREGVMGLDEARRKALALGIEMQVDENESGERIISFFGHRESTNALVGKLMVIEPPDFVW
jgi:hypothetical protein